MTDQECAVSTEEVLAEIADAVASKPKKERKAKHDPEGGVLPEKKERKARAKKEPEYQKDENGELILGEDGQPLPVVKEKKVREPKLDADGNPITRARVLPTHEASTISWDEEKVSKYKGARAAMAAMRAEGQTIAEYLEAGGDKGFLRFYVRDGAATVTPYTPE